MTGLQRDSPPPQDLSAERSVLAAMLLGDDAARLGARLLTPRAFYGTPHARVFSAIVALAERGEPADLITVAAELKAAGHLDAVGGNVFLAGLMDEATTAANLSAHAALVLRAAGQRELLTISRGLAEQAVEAKDPTAAAFDSAEQLRVFATAGVGAQLPRTRSRAAVTRLADVRALPIEWLWQGYIPLGMLTVLDGDPGLGKSTALLDIAARLSRGDSMPDGSPGPAAGGVVILSAEDDPARVIRPRLDAMGANVDRIATVAVREPSGQQREPTICPDDLEAVEQAIAEVGARLVVVDPLMAYLPADVNAHRDQDVRRALRALCALAERSVAAVIVIRHFNKAQGGPTLYRGGGSIGIIGAARSGLVLAPDPDDETGELRVLAVAKSNLSPPVPALRFRLVGDAGVTFPRVSWLGKSAHTAASLLAIPVDATDRSVAEDARAFLLDILGAGAVPAQDIKREARRAGISERTLRRAKARLPIKTRHVGRPGGAQEWVWEMAAEPLQDGYAPKAGHLGASDGCKPLCRAAEAEGGHPRGDGQLGAANFDPEQSLARADPGWQSLPQVTPEGLSGLAGGAHE